MVKRLVFFPIIAIHVCAFTNQQVPDMAMQKKDWVVERLSVDRIKKHAEWYRRQLKRSATTKKLLIGVGGGASAALVAWVCYNWFFAENKELKPKEQSPSAPEISEQDFRQRVLTVLESEISQENRIRRSLWESIKSSAHNATVVAFYCFMGTKFLGLLYSMWDEIGPKVLNYLGMFSCDEQIKVHERVVSLIGQTMSGIIPEYERAVTHTLALGGNDSVSLSFVTFLGREIVKQHVAFIHALELVLACLAEVQENGGRGDAVLRQAFDNQIRVFWEVLDAYAETLEVLLNSPLDSAKPALCKRVSMICRQIHLQSSRFLAECKNIVLAA